MKILHFADTHVGMETYGTMDVASGMSTRVIDELNAMDGVIDYAINSSVDLVLFCGDAYKNREPSQTHQREFARRIRRLSEAKIPTVIIIGNHDLSGAPGKASSVEIFDTLDIENIYIAAKPGILNIKTNHGDIQVAAFPWLRRNALLTREESKNVGVSRLIGQLQDIISTRLIELAAEIDVSRPAVLAAHLAVAEARTGTEKTMIIGNDPVVMLSTIANPVYDYVALGHVHRAQVLCETPPVVYAGSLERLDFGDEGQDKGFYIVDIEQDGPAKNTSYEFHSIDARRFLTLAIDVDDRDLDPTGSILKKIYANADAIRDAVVRLKISLPGHLSNLLREGEIFKALKEAYNVSIAKELRRTSSSRGSGWIKEAMTPLEALDRYLETTGVPVERRKKLLEYGEKLISEKFSSDRGSYAV
ncbi:MAG: exonuclease SbcCD subunit D [Dehalococcoidia bacterium]|nr:exonuclease SbcCD subunit D [Dehalococcoidia bacterium]